LKRKLKRSKIFYHLSLLLIGVLFLVAGCGGGSHPPSVPQKGRLPSGEKKKAEATKAAEKKEPEKKEAEYTYDPTGKTDPFKPFIQLSSVKERTFLTPLQKYEISQLKLVAVISTPEGNIALVEDSAGKGYFLKKGTEIGKSDGRVVKILKDRVVIEEVYQDILGKKKTNEISLHLHRIEGGEES
jgi:type IV pilus assembly protein PilP